MPFGESTGSRKGAPSLLPLHQKADNSLLCRGSVSEVTPGVRDPITFARTRLLVKDFAKSWHFYRDKLGLTPAKGHGSPPYGEFLTNGRPIVSLYDRKLMAKAVGLKPGRYSRRNSGRSAIIFEVKDVDRVAQQLRRRGVRLLAGPTDRPLWMLRTIHLQDPDGYLVEIYSPLKRR
jgi:lactoylglutathione lyase